MALVIEDLAEAMKAGTYLQPSASAAVSGLGQAIATYIKDNAEIEFSWSATNAVGAPDPTTTAMGEIIVLEFVMSPSMATDQASALQALDTQFITGMMAATYNITDSGFSTSPGNMSSSPQISTLQLNITGDNRDTAFNKFASDIIDWVTSQVPTIPCGGSHGSYSGSGVVVSIS